MPSDVTGQMLPELFGVRRMQRETLDTFTFELEPTNGAGEFSFAPGQFNMLYVFGVGEVPISISGDPASAQTIVHTVRAVGAVTKAMAKLKRGDVVGVRGPFGKGWPIEQAVGKDVVIVAGGVGLAPVRPVLYHVAHNRGEYRSVTLLYGTRTPKDLLYSNQFDQWRRRFHFDVEITVDAAGTDWGGNVGVVTKLVAGAQFEPLNAVAIVCGPEIMMRFTLRELLIRGMKTENIFISMERSMKCGIGLCGHCQLGHTFICKDGPVYRFDAIEELFGKREM